MYIYNGKTIGGAGRLANNLIKHILQNYYGDAIRRNKGDVDQMLKDVVSIMSSETHVSQGSVFVNLNWISFHRKLSFSLDLQLL